MFNKSTIDQHLLDKKVTTPSFGRFFYLSASKAVYIKLSNSNLCHQKEFVYNLKSS